MKNTRRSIHKRSKIVWLFVMLLMPFFTQAASENVLIYGKDEIVNALENSDADDEAHSLRDRILVDIDEFANPEADLSQSELQFEEFLSNPENFFSGPKVTDIGFIMTEKLIGSPAVYALSHMNDAVPPPDDVSENKTAFTHILEVAAYLGSFLTMILICYFIVGGGLNMARDGEFLGRDWDSLYAPLRTVIGLVGTWPSPVFGGLSLSQIIVLMAFLMGLGIGSAAFTALSPILMTKPIISSSFDDVKVEDLARTVGAMQICGMIQAVEHGQGAIDAFRSQPYKMKYEPEVYDADDDITVIVHSNVPDWQTCGYISREIYSVDTSTQAVNAGFFSLDAWESMIETGSGLTNDGYIKAQLENDIAAQVIFDAVPKMVVDLTPLAAFTTHKSYFHEELNAIRNGEDNRFGMQYWYAVDAFKHRVNGYVDDAASTEFMAQINQEFTDMVEQNGMMLGGAYQYLITKRQNAIAQAVEDSLPETESLSLSRLRDSPWYRDAFAKVAAWWNGLWTDADHESDALTSALGLFNEVVLSVVPTSPDPTHALMRQKELTSADTAVGNFSSYVSMEISEWVTGIARVGENTSQINPDPVLEMHSLGVKIQQALMAGKWVSWVKSKTDKLGMTGDAGEPPTEGWAGLIFASLLGSLLLITFLYTIVIPGLPLIMFTVSALGLFLFLIKACIAAPFWWGMHAHPVGNDMFGKAGPGYPLLLTLFLSPFLMVAGLLAAIALTRLSGWLVNLMFMPSINIMNDGFTAPTNWISYYVLYGITMLVLVYKNYGLMYELRQVVLKWMGVDNAYTDFGEKDAQLKAVGLGAYAGTVIEKGQAGAGNKGQ